MRCVRILMRFLIIIVSTINFTNKFTALAYHHISDYVCTQMTERPRDLVNCERMS